MPWAHALVLLACAVSASGCSADPEPVAAAQPAKAKALLAQYQCGSCHQIPGVPSSLAGGGPSLNGFGRRSYIAGEVPNSHDAAARWIMAPASLVPDTQMPAMGVSPQDARVIASYLLALK